ncbi:MAG: hypothetical protein IJZ13_05720 [Clostridia bacterium]|nr:hypothetical protein [Clostridia bacterium]
MGHKVRRIGRRIAALTACLLLAAALPVGAVDVAPAECYWYNAKYQAVTIPEAYELVETVELSAMTEATLSGLTDSFLGADGRLYLLDKSGLILILDEHYRLIKQLDTFQKSPEAIVTVPPLAEGEELLEDTEGDTVTLNAPEGLFVDNAGFIYVADTENMRVLRMNDEGMVDRIFNEPDNLTGTEEDLDYLPSKLVVDSAGRIFVVVRNVNMGIVVLDPNGQFITYRGAPSVTLSIFDAFWRKFSTEAQRDRMKTYVPTEYNNVTINEEDFIFGTISSLSDEDLLNAIWSGDSSGKVAPLKKLNLAGEDILRRQGMYAPVGDLVTEAENLSAFRDVALSDCGIYTALDTNKGRLFTYDDDGELLFAFGGIGNKLGQFSRPVAVAYAGDDLLVCDGYTNRVYRFAPTAYGALVLSAVKYYYNGDYDASYDCWGQVLEYNSNMSLAYVGVGKAYYQEKDYVNAMECFKIAGDVKQYSNAYRKVRDGLVRSYFGYIVGGVLVLSVIALVVGLYKRLERFSKED